MSNSVKRPWGYYIVLVDDLDLKIKKIVVHQGHRLSLQRHRFRDEHWYITSGRGIITRDHNIHELSCGESIDILADEKHRIANNSYQDLVFIEIQTGDYFGEDDIERIEDDYGRE